VDVFGVAPEADARVVAQQSLAKLSAMTGFEYT